MKKQKPQASVLENKTTSENELAIITVDNGDISRIKEQVFGKLAKSRTDVMVYLISNNKEACLQLPEIAEQVNRGKCFIGDITSIKEEINSGKIKWFFMCDVENEYMLQTAISFFGGNKKQFTDEAIYIGEKTKLSGKEKIGLYEKAKNAFFNFVGQLVTPTHQQDFTLPFHYFPKSVVITNLTEFTQSAQTLAANANYHEVPFVPAILTTKEFTARKRNWKSLFSNAIKMRTNWFIKSPLAEKDNWWRLAFLGMTVFALLSMLVMSQQFGMTWDEKRHNDYSKESLKYFESFGEDTTCLGENLPTQEFRFYGEHFNVIAAFLYSHVLPMGEFETRHLLNALYGFLAMLFASLLAKEIGSWRTGFFAFLLIYLSPVFFAHSMNNPTDIPFAAGFAIAMYYLIKIFRALPKPKFSHVFMAGVGVGIAVGSRVGGVLLYAYAGMFFGIHFLMNIKQNGFKYFINYVKVMVGLVVVGHLLSVSLWPFGQQHIFTNWYEALKKSTEGAYFTYNHELFEGVRMYMANVPWYYLPKFIIINAPLMVLGGLAISILTILFWKKAFNTTWILLFFVLFALVFPIVYAEYQSMYYYNGWRHYLFIYPSLIVLAALGWEALMRLINKPIVAKVTMVIVFGLALLPTIWMVKNNPNECVYFNELVGGTKGAYGKYETDYYSNSCRAAGEWLAQQEPSRKLLVAINNEPQTAAYYANKINPNMEFKWVREYEEQKPFWDYEILTSRTYSQKELIDGSFPPKGTIHVIEADGIPLAAIIKREDYNMPLGYAALNAKNNDSAVYYFTKATQYNPKDEEPWRLLGEAYMNKGSADTAITMLNKSIELSPENYSAYSDLGQVYMNLKKDMSNAIKNFEKSTALKYNFAEGYYYEASCYMSQQDYNHAITLMENAIKRGGSGIPEIYYNLGVCYLYSGMYKKAEENFINTLTLSPNLAMGYRALAEAFSKQNKNSEAQQCMERYRQLGGQ